MSTSQEQFIEKLTQILDLTKQEDAYDWIGSDFNDMITELFHIRDILIVDIRQGLTSKREVPVTEPETVVEQVVVEQVVAPTKSKKSKVVEAPVEVAEVAETPAETTPT